jgi:alpha-tubulin suppressor-like RCC1 family protein
LLSLNITGTTTVIDSNGNSVLVQRRVIAMEGSIGQFMVVLLNDNTIYTWGLDSNGRLGKGTAGSFTAQINPVKIKNNNIQNEIVTQLAVGTSHSIILTKSNKLFGWGGNSLGQIGDGTTSDRFEPTAVLQNGALLNKIIISVKAKGDFTIVLSQDGLIYSWGSNTNYELGDGTTITRTSPVLVVGTIFKSGETTAKITLIAAGTTHSIAYSSTTGQFYAWGRNNVGQLGNGTLKTWMFPVNSSAVTQLLSENDNDIPQQLFAGDQTTFIWGKTKFYAFGLNGNGQLGESSTTNQLLGNGVDSGEFNGTIISFCTDFRHTMFITNSSSKFFTSFVLSFLTIFLLF